MSNAINLAGGIRPYLIILVNVAHGLVLDPDTATFDNLQLLDANIIDFSSQTARNSEVYVNQEASGDSGEVSVRLAYNRLRLNKLFELRSTNFAVTTETTVTQLLPLINQRLQTVLTMDDLVDVNFDSEFSSFTLNARPTSLYVFGSIQVSVTYPPPDNDP